MRALSCLFAALLLGLPACTDVDEITLTQAEADELVDRFEVTVETQQELTEFVFAATRGDLDIAGYGYVPPSEANGWTGELTVPNGVFPFGAGALTISFRTEGGGVPVDPYAFDLRTSDVVDVDAVVDFVGTTPGGLDVSAQADLAMTTLQNGADVVRARIDGTYDVLVDGYDADLLATGLQLEFDLVAARVTDAVGELSGTVDIPDFVADADFVLTGLGDEVRIAVDVVATTLEWTVSLFDF